MRGSVSSRAFMRGSSLLDELTAVVVISVGLLGLARFEGRVQNLSAGTESQTIALALAQGRLERLRGIAAEPGGADPGYAQIAESNEVVSTLGDWRLPTPFALRVEVMRFRLQDNGTGNALYFPAKNEVQFDANVPEFKRVSVSASWTNKNGIAQSVVLPGIVSPSAF